MSLSCSPSPGLACYDHSIPRPPSSPSPTGLSVLMISLRLTEDGTWLPHLSRAAKLRQSLPTFPQRYHPVVQHRALKSLALLWVPHFQASLLPSPFPEIHTKILPFCARHSLLGSLLSEPGHHWHPSLGTPVTITWQWLCVASSAGVGLWSHALPVEGLQKQHNEPSSVPDPYGLDSVLPSSLWHICSRCSQHI